LSDPGSTGRAAWCPAGTALTTTGGALDAGRETNDHHAASTRHGDLAGKRARVELRDARFRGPLPELVCHARRSHFPLSKGALMAEETVEIVIAADGTVQMSVKGVAGTQCVADTDPLVSLLGGEVEHQELTEEAYQEAEVEEQDRLWQG
jgi:hypothetical protein